MPTLVASITSSLGYSYVERGGSNPHFVNNREHIKPTISVAILNPSWQNTEFDLRSHKLIKTYSIPLNIDESFSTFKSNKCVKFKFEFHYFSLIKIEPQ